MKFTGAGYSDSGEVAILRFSFPILRSKALSDASSIVSAFSLIPRGEDDDGGSKRHHVHNEPLDEGATLLIIKLRESPQSIDGVRLVLNRFRKGNYCAQHGIWK